MNQQDTLEATLQRYQGFLQQDPNNPHLISQVVDLQLQLGQLDAADTLLENALTEAPQQTELLFRQASLCLAKHDAVTAVEILNHLLTHNIHSAAVYYNLAYAHLMQGHAEAAEAALDRIEQNDIAQVPGYFVLRARVSHHLGNLEQALQSAQQSIAQGSETAEAMGLLALLNFDQGEAETARQWADKALALHPENHEALVTLGSLALDEQAIHTADQHFKLITQRYPDSGRGWLGQGLSLMAVGNLAEAHDALLKTVQLMPKHLGSWNTLAWCQILSQDLSAAKTTLEQALAINHNFAETYGTLAVIAVMQDRINDATTDIKRALGLDAGSFAARYAQSLLLAKQGKEQVSAKMIETMLDTEIETGKGTLRQALNRLQQISH